MLATIAIGTAITAWVVMRDDRPPPPPEAPVVPMHLDSPEQMGPLVGLIPDGEWWGRGRTSLVAIRMDGTEGRGAAMIDDVVTEFEVSLSLSLELELVYSLSDGVKWIGHVHDPDVEVGSEDDVIDEIVIDRVEAPPETARSFEGMRLHRAVRTPPAAPLDAATLRRIEQLRNRLR